MAIRQQLLLGFLVISASCAGSEFLESCGPGVIREIINGLEGALDYFHRYSPLLNIDADLFVRIARDQLGVLQTKSFLFNDLNLQEYVETKITELKNTCDEILKISVPIIMTSDPDYAGKYIKIFTAPNLFSCSYDRRDFNFSTLEQPIACAEQDIIYDGDKSDVCLRELLDRCEFSRTCLEMETHYGLSGYFLTHQALYFMFGEGLNCPFPIDENAFRDMRDKFCTNVYRDALDIESGNFQPANQDLFMEQIGFCGMWGYEGFARLDWIRTVLSWRTPSKCFYNPRTYKCRDKPLPAPRPRSKRNEKQLPEGCSAHGTGAGISALVEFLRFCAFV